MKDMVCVQGVAQSRDAADDAINMNKRANNRAQDARTRANGKCPIS